MSLDITVPLYRAAHGRTGDKGDRSNISVIAWHPALYPLLVAQLTPERVAAQFRYRSPSRVQRFLLPKLGAITARMPHSCSAQTACSRDDPQPKLTPERMIFACL